MVLLKDFLEILHPSEYIQIYTKDNKYVCGGYFEICKIPSHQYLQSKIKMEG